METTKNTVKAVVSKKKPKSKKQPQFYHANEKTPNVKALLLGEYYNIHTRMMNPVTSRWVERVHGLLMDWADKDTSLRITDFTDDIAIGLDPFSYYDFINKFAQLKIAHDYAMRRIASRRELGGLTNKYNTTMITRVQSHYDSTWMMQEEKMARMAKDMNATSTGNIKVIINEFERLEGEDAPTYVDSPLATQELANEYHAKRSEFAIMEQALLEEEVLHMRTPEEVAQGINRQSELSPWEGKGQYVAKQNIKKRIKEVEERIYE